MSDNCGTCGGDYGNCTCDPIEPANDTDRTPMKLFGVRDPKRVLDAAVLVGGEKLASLARYYIEGTLPPGSNAVEFVKTVCEEMSTSDYDRKQLMLFVVALSGGNLDAWAVERTTPRGAKKLTALHELDREAFNKTIAEVVAAQPTIGRAAEVLGVSYRTMLRYMKEANVHVAK